MQYEKIEKYAFRRFCSADLADQRAYRWGNFGTKDRIFTNGEQDGEGWVPVVFLLLVRNFALWVGAGALSPVATQSASMWWIWLMVCRHVTR